MILYLLDSEFVNLAIHNKKQLYLVLKTNLYCYNNITKTNFTKFLSSDSKGSYLNQHKSTIFSDYELIYSFDDSFYEFLTDIWLDDSENLVKKYQFNKYFRYFNSLVTITEIRKIEK
jgi:hypothetical protein